jgi:hypothetical protein
MSRATGRLTLLLFLVLLLDVSPAPAQVKSAPSRPVPNAALRRVQARTGLANTSGVQSLTLNPDAVYAGQSSTVTVELLAPAPAGGTKVVLGAAPAGVATVPASITVAAGQATGTFVAVTTAGAGNATLEISAVKEGATGKLSASLQVVAAPPDVAGFAGFPQLVKVGTSVSGTVKIVGTAPAGGVTVPLYTTVIGDAVVPASVTVPAGQSSAPLTITAGQKSGKVTLYTNAGARQAGQCPGACAALQIVATPELASLDFKYSGTPAATEAGVSQMLSIGISQPWPDPVVVSLASSNPQAASLAPSITFQNDVSAGSVIVNTHAVTAPTTVTFTATCAACVGTTSRSVSLQVTPALAVSSISVAQGDVKGGAQTTVTVTLSAPAPSTGRTLNLSSSNPSICMVPKAMVVPAGQTSTTVPVSTQAVVAPATVTLTATLAGGTAKSTTVHVVP